MKNLEALTVAALLSEIGRICIRARSDQPGDTKPEAAGIEWLGTFAADAGAMEEVLTILKGLNAMGGEEDHRGHVLQRVRHSLDAGEPSLFEESSISRITPLTNLLSQVAIEVIANGKPARVKADQPYSFRLESLSGGAVFSQPSHGVTNSVEEYQDLLARFEGDFRLWLKGGGGIGPLLMILEKHFHTVPLCPADSDHDLRDVSLFDHVKVTAAVAAALYRYEQRQERDASLSENGSELLMVHGDVSGVQDFLYSLSSKGALKTLRARSFFMEMLCEHCASELVLAFSLNEANILYTGGGGFSVLAHHCGEVTRALESFQGKINNELKTYGELSLIVAPAPLSLDEIRMKGSGRLREDLEKKISELKRKKHFTRLEEVLRPQEPKHKTASCSICNTDDHEEKDFETLEPLPTGEARVACPFCASMHRLGSRLGDVTYLAGEIEKPGQKKGFALPKLDGSLFRYTPIGDAAGIPQDATRVFCLNSWNIEDYRGEISRQILVANKIRKRGQLTDDARKADTEDTGDEASASFAGLAAASRGIDRVGVLRMDVDHLGRVLSTGLREELNLARLSGLSRALNLFFKQQIPRICDGKLGTDRDPTNHSEKTVADEGRNVSVVYSGGDDLFIVGAWDEVAELSMDIQHSFSAYCGHNPAVTISGGMVAGTVHLPIHTMARMAGDAEHQSKDEGRNRITLFQSRPHEVRRGIRPRSFTVPWDQVGPKVSERLKQLLALSTLDEDADCFEPGFSRRLIYRLLNIHDVWRREGKLYLPHMAYLIARIQKTLKESAVDQEKDREAEKMALFSALLNEREMSFLHLPLLWFEMLCRGRSDRQQ